MKKLLLLHTGGTLGMVPRTDGMRACSDGAEVFRFIPEALKLAEIDTRVLFSEDSANLQVAHWCAIAEAIALTLDHYDGFVVIHGTDTMAYTAAALSYMLANLPKPVILTGAQRPIAVIRTDAKANLVNALELACQAIPEVGLFFNHRLFRGNRAKKVSIHDYDAFASPNFPPLAEVGLHIRIRDELLRRPSGLFRLDMDFSDRVLVLRPFPGMNPQHWMPLLDTAISAIVIEAFGSGNVPIHENSLLGFIEEATQKGKLIVLNSQAMGGTVDLDLYESARRAGEAGAVSARDMTIEATVVKLMFLLGQYPGDVDKVRKTFHLSLAGEIDV